jgi:hypothetical protein
VAYVTIEFVTEEGLSDQEWEDEVSAALDYAGLHFRRDTVIATVEDWDVTYTAD